MKEKKLYIIPEENFTLTLVNNEILKSLDVKKYYNEIQYSKLLDFEYFKKCVYNNGAIEWAMGEKIYLKDAILEDIPNDIICSGDIGPRVAEVIATEEYTLRLIFTNNEEGLFDVKPYLDSGVFKELQDLNYFKQVKIDNGTVVWPHEQDFCPDTLYLKSEKIK